MKKYVMEPVFSSWGFVCATCGNDSVYSVRYGFGETITAYDSNKKTWAPIILATVCSEECFNLWILQQPDLN